MAERTSTPITAHAGTASSTPTNPKRAAHAVAEATGGKPIYGLLLDRELERRRGLPPTALEDATPGPDDLAGGKFSRSILRHARQRRLSHPGIPDAGLWARGGRAARIDVEPRLVVVGLRVGALETAWLPGARGTAVLLAVLAAHAAGREELVRVHALVALTRSPTRPERQHEKQHSEHPHHVLLRTACRLPHRPTPRRSHAGRRSQGKAEHFVRPEYAGAPALSQLARGHCWRKIRQLLMH